MAALNKGGKGYKGYERLPHMWRVAHEDGVLVRKGRGQYSGKMGILRHGELVFPAGTVENVPWHLFKWDAMKQERVFTGWTTMQRLCIWLGGGEEQIKGYVTVEATSAGGPVFLRADTDFPVYQ